MSDGDLVKLTVNLTPVAYSSLESTAGMTGDTKTDTVNRALRVYDLLVRMALQGEGVVVFEVTPGNYARVEIAPRT